MKKQKMHFLKNILLPLGITCLLGFLGNSHLAGQAPELPSGYLNRLYYSGAYVDYQIPEMSSANLIYLKVAGGDGGAVGAYDKGKSGKGATIEGYLKVGNDQATIPGGSTLRFIIGQKGNKGGGGGGTAVAVKKKGQNSWTLVMVAGGGGGSGYYIPGIEGQSGTAGAAGKNGDQRSLNNGGADGMGGGQAGGGGYKGDGGGFSDASQADPRVQKVIGKKGNKTNNEPVGAAGGQGDDGSYGGFGYGSGGAGWKNNDGHLSGGGGGGYSGGGGASGGTEAGGGGSYANELLFSTVRIDRHGSSTSLDDGFAFFKFPGVSTITPVTNSDKCVRDYAGRTANGNNIYLYDCNNGAFEKWLFEQNAIRFLQATDKCIDLSNGNISEGANIWLWDCRDGNRNQQWVYDGINRNIRLKMNMDWCMTLDQGSTRNTSNIQLGKCDLSAAQQWKVDGLNPTTVSAYNRIHFLKDPNKCVDVYQGNTADRTNIQIYQCHMQPAQQWFFDGNTIRFSKDPDKCLDLDHSQTNNGTNIQLWACNGTNAQKWIYDPLTLNFRSWINPDKCLDVNQNGTANGTNIQLWDCNLTVAQQFTIESIPDAPCYEDVTPPVAKCKGFQNTANVIPTAAMIDDGSYDNCRVESRHLAYLGSQQYKLTVTDPSGNTSSCTARVY